VDALTALRADESLDRGPAHNASRRRNTRRWSRRVPARRGLYVRERDSPDDRRALVAHDIREFASDAHVETSAAVHAERFVGNDRQAVVDVAGGVSSRVAYRFDCGMVGENRLLPVTPLHPCATFCSCRRLRTMHYGLVATVFTSPLSAMTAKSGPSSWLRRSGPCRSGTSHGAGRGFDAVGCNNRLEEPRRLERVNVQPVWKWWSLTGAL
jgi:hypothetical protein